MLNERIFYLTIFFKSLFNLKLILLIFKAFGKPGLGAPTGGFGSFGQPSTLQGIGQQQALGQPQAPLNPDEAFAESIYNVSIFGDERDIVIAKWNYLQAMWGNGKAFYAKNLPPVEITPQNVRKLDLCFKNVHAKIE